jgi:large subunit ribosomal protein L9
MAKTEVILVRNVIGLGAETDQVRVAAGYARNYLVPNGLAVPLTGANKRRLDVLRQRRADRESHELNSMAELGKSLSKVHLTITVKTGDDGKMFGSVTSGSIADALKIQLDVALDKKKIHLEKPIHTLGDHEVELRLHPEVKLNLKVVVKSANPAPEVPVTDDKKDAPHTEKRGRRTIPGGKPVVEEPKKLAAPEAKAGKGKK